ncbi:MAG TPA: hypothetical protein VLU06_10600 [Thermoanaerobaculia bacterium]|nr:hypothetical protein [Thermoanaerobaculia bacterium]
MRKRGWLVAAGVGLFLAGTRLPASECGRFELSVIVDGSTAAEYPFRDRTYIEALRDKSFSLRLHNPTAERVAVALSVDGLNVVDAKRTSAAGATKWILAPGQTVDIPGWQVSGQTARRFFFTDTARSYAKWIGDTHNVGVIEAVFFREKTQPVQPLTVAPPPGKTMSRDSAAGAPEGRIEGGVPGGQIGGESGSSKPAPQAGASVRESDRFAATGIGDKTSFPVQWVSFDEDPVPAARIALRYEYRRDLVRLGVLPREDELYARDRGRGFEHEYAPDPRH